MTKAEENAGDPHTYSFVAEEHLKGSIDDVTSTLGERSFAELNDLHDYESKTGQKRAGMLSAIDRERTARGEAHASALDIARKSAEAAGAQIYTDEDFDEATKAAIAERDALKSQVDTLTKERDDGAQQANADVEGAKERIAELESQVTALTTERDAAVASRGAATGEARAPKATKKSKPRTFELDGEAEIEGATTVAFADANGVTFPAIADLEFGEGDFLAGSAGHVLQRAISFDGTEPQSSISAVYLLDGKGKPVAVSRMMQPMIVGGGRKGMLPAGSLRFDREAAAPTPQQAMAQQASAT